MWSQWSAENDALVVRQEHMINVHIKNLGRKWIKSSQGREKLSDGS